MCVSRVVIIAYTVCMYMYVCMYVHMYVYVCTYVDMHVLGCVSYKLYHDTYVHAKSQQYITSIHIHSVSIYIVYISRLTVVSRGAKKKQAYATNQ